MFNKKVGAVLFDEKERLLNFYERNNSLKELLNALDNQLILDDEKVEINNKILKDAENTKKSIENWWSDMLKKYQWEYHKDGMWSIDFKTGEIFLVEKQCNC